MAKIIFMRTAPYKYKLANNSLYDSFNLVARRLYEPEIQKNPKLPNIIKPNLILCSPRKRSIQTAEAVVQKFNLRSKIHATPLLHEVLFSMSEIMPKDRFDAKRISIARMKFIHAFANGKLSEKKEETKLRIEKLLHYVNKKSGIVLCCLHGFFMKLIQLYLIDNQIFEKPKQLINKFEPNKKLFDFCEYFIVDTQTFGKYNGGIVI